MLNALIFVVLLLIAVVLLLVVLIWQPGDRVTPEKARMIRASAGISAILIFFAAGSLMLGGMVTVKGESNEIDERSTDVPGSVEVPAGNEKGNVDESTAEVVVEEKRSGEDDEGEPKGIEANDPGPPEQLTPEGVDPDASAAEQLKQVKVGSLEKETIQKSVESMRPYVQACYEDTLKEFPDAAGKVVIGFTIIGEGGQGRVEMSELEAEKTTLFDSKLHDCMLEAVGDLEFEVPEGGGKVKVRYPFNFETDEEP